MSQMCITEFFQVFAHLAEFLGREANGWQKQIGKDTFESVRRHLMDIRVRREIGENGES